MINENKEVLSFFIYMWNAWNFNECMVVFDGDTDNPYDLAHHIWNKYLNRLQENGHDSAVANLIAELSEGNLDKLVNRACTLYYGRANK